MSKALLIVDVQNDFTEGGSLGVEGGNQVARDISTYLEKYGSEYELVVATRDWHKPNSDNGGHITPDPDFVATWPPHCVINTRGAEYHPELWPAGGRYPHDEILKGEGVPAYSGFEGTNKAGKSMREILTDANIREVDVVGLALDYCVKETALDAVKAGFNARVLKNLAAAIHPDGPAESTMEQAGITIVDAPN